MKPSQQHITTLRNIPLLSILKQSTATQDPYDKHKWHTPKGPLSINEQKFINWHTAKGGGGAIDLVMHLHNLSFKQALGYLQAITPSNTQTPLQKQKPKLRLPQEDPTKLTQTIHYLTKQRALPTPTIEKLIFQQKIYADTYANAVFVMLAKDKQIIGAEIRATGQTPWHGIAPGTRKDKGCFYIAAKGFEAYILCESAIDAISCHSLYPQACCLSTAGAHPNPAWITSLLEKKKIIYCGYDNDPTGQSNAQKLIQRYPNIKRLVPKSKDWNLDLLESYSFPEN